MSAPQVLSSVYPFIPATQLGEIRVSEEPFLPAEFKALFALQYLSRVKAREGHLGGGRLLVQGLFRDLSGRACFDVTPCSSDALAARAALLPASSWPLHARVFLRLPGGKVAVSKSAAGWRVGLWHQLTPSHVGPRSTLQACLSGLVEDHVGAALLPSEAASLQLFGAAHEPQPFVAYALDLSKSGLGWAPLSDCPQCWLADQGKALQHLKDESLAGAACAKLLSEAWR